ncbi:MAG: protein kinase [Bacteroidota bacterium]
MSVYNVGDKFGPQGRYTLISRVGIGGFSEVWKVEDNKLKGQIFALKIYAPDKGLTDSGIEQFSEEYLKTKDLDNNKYLFKPFHYDDFEGKPYLVMDYCERGSLDTVLTSSGAFQEPEVARVMLQVSTALDYLHTLQPEAIIHQDIKPDNILIKNDKYLLSDFGISSKLKKTLRKGTNSARDFTPAYSQPERFWGRPMTTPKSDVFSLGVMLYEVCTRELPWSVNGEGMGGRALLTGASVPDLPGDFPQNLNTVVRSCMDVYPSLRPTSSELKHISQKFLSEGFWDVGLLSEKSIDHDEKILVNGSSNGNRSTHRMNGNSSGGFADEHINEENAALKEEVFTLKSQLEYEIGKTVGVDNKIGKTQGWLIAILIIFLLVAGFTLTQNRILADVGDRFDSLHDKASDLISDLKSEVSGVSDIDFEIGRSLGSVTGYDHKYRMYFNTYQPILLESVDIRGNKLGTVNIQLYDKDGTLLKASDTEISTRNRWIQSDLDFEIEAPGEYYLTFSGGPSLAYTKTNSASYARYKIDNLLEITGSGTKRPGTDYYQYFYNWNVALLTSQNSSTNYYSSYWDRDRYNGENIELAVSNFVIITLVCLVFLVFVSRWVIYDKAKLHGWSVLIPIYGTIVLLQLINKPWWWLFLMMIPGVGLIWVIWALNLLAKRFGKNTGFSLGLIFLPFIFFPILAFSNCKYQVAKA